MITRFEAEPRATKPQGFDAWLIEMGIVADCEGWWILVMAIIHAPVAHCQYLITIPGAWPELVARAHYADSHHDFSLIARRAGLSS